MNPHQQHSTSLAALISSVYRNRSLIWQMTKRDVLGRYRGSMMGLAWSFFNPLLMLVVYTLVFSGIFRMRWGLGGEESKSDFAIVLFVGMIIYGLFAECVNRSPGLVLSNPNYVKKVVFPLETLPIVALGAALFHALISTIVLLATFFVLKGYLNWTVLLLPIILLPFLLAILGVAWTFASLGVFLRDVGQTVGVLTTVMLFLAPVFYPFSAVPERYQVLLMANPLTFIIEQARAVLIWGRLPDWIALAKYTVLSIAVTWIGFAWFQKTRKGFADVL